MFSFLKHTFPTIFMGTAWATASSTIHFQLLQWSHLEAQPIGPWLVGGAVHSGCGCVSRRGLCTPTLAHTVAGGLEVAAPAFVGEQNKFDGAKKKAYHIFHRRTKNSLEMLTIKVLHTRAWAWKD